MQLTKIRMTVFPLVSSHTSETVFWGLTAARGGFDAFAGGKQAWSRGIGHHLHIQRGLNHETPQEQKTTLWFPFPQTGLEAVGSPGWK